MYLEYYDYQQMGGTLDETAFDELEFEARAIIDYWTFNRLKNETEFPEAVKRCVYKLINLINNKIIAESVSIDNDNFSTTTINPGIVSESNDGVSTTYNTLSAQEAVDTMKKETEDVVRMYLNGVKNSLGHKLLYRGIYPNE